jgi:hypothetical protein
MAAPQCAVEWCGGGAEDVSKQLQLRVGQRQFDPCLFAFCALLKMLLIAYGDTIALPFFNKECGACGASLQNASSYCSYLVLKGFTCAVTAGWAVVFIRLCAVLRPVVDGSLCKFCCQDCVYHLQLCDQLKLSVTPVTAVESPKV